MDGVDQSSCQICSDAARGMHYGVVTCEGCKGFFKRVTSMTNPPSYRCYFGRNCPLTPETRNNCKACRLQRCVDLGMMEKLSKKTRTCRLSSEGQEAPAKLVDPGVRLGLTDVQILENDDSVVAALRVSGLDDLDALKATPSGLTLIRKVLSGSAKSAPSGIVRNVMVKQNSTHLGSSPEIPNSASDGESGENLSHRSDISDGLSTGETSNVSERSGSDQESRRSSVEMTESPDLSEVFLPPMPPLILGTEAMIPPPPPLLHIPNFGADNAAASTKNDLSFSFDPSSYPRVKCSYSALNYVNENQYVMRHPQYKMPQYPDPGTQLRKRKRGRPRKVRPVSDDWYSYEPTRPPTIPPIYVRNTNGFVISNNPGLAAKSAYSSYPAF